MTPSAFSLEVGRLYMEELARKKIRCPMNEAAWKSDVMSVAKVLVVKAWPEWKEKKDRDWSPSPSAPGPFGSDGALNNLGGN